MTSDRIRVSGIERLCLVSADPARLALFYEAAFGARVLSRETGSDASMDIALTFGAQCVALRGFDARGKPYPADSDAADSVFQHFAIVVADIDVAHRRLRAIPNWTPISHAGPQRLPASSGGVSAFKFRDPEGHPLELLEFPADSVPERWLSAAGSDNVLGIDHTAISVADTDRSIAFYESLGLRVSARSINAGPEQDLLDGLDGVEVEVTALSAADATPHVELLCYRYRYRYRDRGPNSVVGAHDVAATRIVFRSQGSRGERLLDPDGHRLVILGNGT